MLEVTVAIGAGAFGLAVGYIICALVLGDRIKALKAELAEAEKTYVKLALQIKGLEFSKRENEREIKLLDKELQTTKAALAEASKNDTRDTKGRFTKAKK
jgi:predicted  nucleic acid-binding Zn-ribbon protein